MTHLATDRAPWAVRDDPGEATLCKHLLRLGNFFFEGYRLIFVTSAQVGRIVCLGV